MTRARAVLGIVGLILVISLWAGLYCRFGSSCNDAPDPAYCEELRHHGF